MTKRYHVYILTNKARSVLYTGVTNNLVRRVGQHKNHEGSAFTKRYKLTKLIHYEEYTDINVAIVREKQIKKWSRARKEALIDESNPAWNDLVEEEK